jgi:hypothetical protein
MNCWMGKQLTSSQPEYVNNPVSISECPIQHTLSRLRRVNRRRESHRKKQHITFVIVCKGHQRVKIVQFPNNCFLR